MSTIPAAGTPYRYFVSFSITRREGFSFGGGTVARERPIVNYDDITSIEADLTVKFPSATSVTILFWRPYEEDKDAKGL